MMGSKEKNIEELIRADVVEFFKTIILDLTHCSWLGNSPFKMSSDNENV